MWMVLDRTDEGNGFIRYVPGSHRRDMRPHGRSAVSGFSQGVTDFNQTDRVSEAVIVAEPGDLIVHHCLTIHRADPNLSERRRWALGLVYFAQRAQPDEKAKRRYAEKLRDEMTKAGKF